jgi:hypothetical protein
VLRNGFSLEQRWRVTGATRAQLMEARTHLTLSGRYGVYGDRKMVKTAVPVELQNNGTGVSAWARPAPVPVFLGSRASTVPTETGFRASMSGGMLGRGASDVELVSVPGGVLIVERGFYTLCRLKSSAGVVNLAYNLGAATFGRLPLAAAHKTMGELHNAVFNPAEALVNWANDRAAGRLRQDPD